MLDPNLAYKCPFSSFIASRTVSSSFLCASTSFVCVSTARWSCVSADFWEVWTKHSPTTSWHVSESSRKAISPSASSASSRRFCCLLLFIIVVLLSFGRQYSMSQSRVKHDEYIVKRERENRIRKMHPQNGKRHDLTTTTPIHYTSFADTRDWSSCALPVRRPNAHIFCWSSHVTSTSWWCACVAGPRDDILDT